MRSMFAMKSRSTNLSDVMLLQHFNLNQDTETFQQILNQHSSLVWS